MTCVSHSHAWGAGELALSPVCGTPGCVPSGVVTKHTDFSGLLCVSVSLHVEWGCVAQGCCEGYMR